MEILDDKTKVKPEICYPCQWGYKIIGKDKNKLLSCISEVMGDKEYSHSIGNSSKNGKFHTHNIKCEVKDKEERDKLFQKFSQHKATKMVF